MSDPVTLLLAAPNDAALARAVAAAGGTSRTVRLLFDHAFGLQQNGGNRDEILAVVAVSDRVDALDRRAEP
jgi:hypothetical protein